MPSSTDASLVAAIDQGTTSTRCTLVDHSGQIVAMDQVEHRQSYPRPGWVEHDPAELWTNTCAVVDGALARAQRTAADVAAIGITNQRETTVVWDRHTGEAVAPAIVWQDTRTQEICDELAAGVGADRYRGRVGLPLATYFAGPKLRWILDNIDGARARAENGELLFGTIDTWLLWNASGGPDGGVHVTDVTNASRTMLMDLDTLAWDPEILDDMRIPPQTLPEIRSSSEIYAEARSLHGLPIAGILGDQQAAMFGQACLHSGEGKNTYGTGSFLLINTGEERILSKHGLITTVCYKLSNQPPVYALEGSIAVTGALVQWLRDNLGIITSPNEIEALANSVSDNGGCYIVPAFSGLFAPYWRSDARGVIAGLTRFVNRGHIARAALEATAFQTREVVEAMQADAEVELSELKVDGGMVVNDLLLQIQADMLGIPVTRPRTTETTALGAAYAAGLAVGFWDELDEIVANWKADRTWHPAMPTDQRELLYSQWKKAVSRTFDWLD